MSDLVVGTSLDVPFAVTADDARHPVGATFEIGGGIYASTSEREMPIITVPATGPPTVAGPAGASGKITGGSDDQRTTVTPLLLTKTADAAEDEVYRGAGRETTFTVTVTNAPKSPTERVEVVDLLPATFRLVDCPDCVSTEVVEIDGTVFTRLVWNIGTLGGESARTLTYTVRIDATEQTLPGATAPGAPTRPDADGDPVTNTVTATGHYTGNVASPADAEISAEAQHTVTVLDLGVVKSADTANFTANGTAEFTLTVRGSSITDAATITLTDIIPDGMCPIVPAGVAVSGVTWPSGCPQPGSAPASSVTGATMTAVEARADGTFAVTFEVAPIPGTAGPTAVTYRTHLRSDYAGGAQTSVGDTFHNVVTVDGTVTPAPGNTVDAGAIDSTNGSEHTVGTERVTLDKQIWANPDRTAISSPNSCPAASSSWTDAADTVARFGDLVCFRIVATVPQGVPMRDGLLTDFVPAGTELVSAATTPASTLAATPVAGNPTSWHIGTRTGEHYYAAAGGRLELVLVLRVVKAPATQPQVAGNLAKLRHVSDAGTVMAARDAVDFTLAPPVPLALDKSATPTTVREGQRVDYTIDVTNRGTAATQTAQPVDVIEVWDALPAGMRCSALVPGSISPVTTPAASCTDPGAGSTGLQARSIIRFVVPATARGGQLQPGATTALRYALTMPTPLAVGSSHENLAAVTRYTVPTTDGTTTPPGASVLVPVSDFGTVHGTPNAPSASDTATVTVPNAQVTKTAVTEIDAVGNNRPNQAVVGETVTYTYGARIPARTSLFSARLTDPLPAGLTRDGAATMTVTPTVPFTTVSGTCPAVSSTVTQLTLCADGTVLFPETWTNTADEDVTFTVTLPTRVTGATTHGTVRTNTATLSAKKSPTDTARPAIGTAKTSTTIVAPTAGVTKVVIDPAGGAKVAAGDTVTYRLTASNPTAGRPALHDWSVTDCAPSELTLVSATPARGSFAPAAISCPAGFTGYRWNSDSSPLLAGAPTTLDVVFRVPADAPAGYDYVNTANIAGKTHPSSTVTGTTVAGTPVDATVTVTDPIIDKTVDRTRVVEGEKVTWTVTAKIPAKTTLHDVALVDTLGSALGSAADVSWGTPVCTGGDAAWTASCATLFRGRADTPASDATQKTGQFLGDFAASPTERVVTVTLSTIIPITTTTTPRTPRNTASLMWFYTPQPGEHALPPRADKTASDWEDVRVSHPKVNLTKQVEDDTPQPGEEFDYTIVASNPAGDDSRTAHDVVIVDTVPVGLDIVTVDQRATWDPAARTVTWRVPSIAPGASVTLYYTATLAASETLGTGAVRNTVVADWSSLPGGDDREYHGSPTHRDVTPQFPRIDAAKSITAPTNAQVVLGQNATYQIRMTNNGRGDATQLDARDVLPRGWEYQPGSARIQGANTPAVAAEPVVTTQSGVQTLTWTDIIPAGRVLPAGQGFTITLEAHPTTAEALAGIGLATEQRNTAAATRVLDTSGAPHNATGDTSYIGTTGTAVARIGKADLSVTKKADSLVAGETGAWTVTVRNNGPDAATGVSVRDVFTTVPGVKLIGASGTGWTCSSPANEQVSCTRANANDTLAPNAAWTIRVQTAIDSTVEPGTTLTNTATVSSSTYDPDPANDTSTATGTTTARADLQMAKNGPISVVAGEQITWTMSLRNLGPSVSHADASKPITITDTVPSQVSGVEVVSTSAGVTCPTVGDGDLTCIVTQDLPVGALRTIELRATVKADTPATDLSNPATSITNRVAVTPGSTPDPQPANDTATSTTRVSTQDRLSIGKRLVLADGEQAQVVPGETFTYEVSVTGQGPSNSRQVTVTDVLPEFSTFTALVDSPDWSVASVSGRTVTFAYAGEIAPRESVSLRYDVLLGDGVVGNIVNRATATSSSKVPTEPVEAPAEARPEADLGVEWDRDRSSVVPGGAGATLVATVTNHGSSLAHDGKVTFRLPTDVVAFSAPGDESGCEASVVIGQPLLITCPAVLSPGASATFTFSIGLPAGQTGSPSINAATSMSVRDTNPANNADVTILDPTPRAQLAVTKTPETAEVAAGENVSWKIRVRAKKNVDESMSPPDPALGLSDAQNVSVSDTLPAGLTLVGTPTWMIEGRLMFPQACTVLSERAFDCGIGRVTAGGAAVVSLVTKLDASTAPGSVVNTASASSTTVDPVTDEPAVATGSGTITTVVSSAVSVKKTSVRPSVDAGTSATFELDVTNTGVSDAAAPVTVTDLLPAGMTFVGVSSGAATHWTCTPATDGSDVSCVLVDRDDKPVSLAAGAAAPTLTVVAAAASDLPAGDIVNRAQVSSSTDPGDEDTSTVTIVTHADLQISKTHAAGSRLVAGAPFTWTMTVTNRGPSDSAATAEDPITVTDVLPRGVTLADSADERCTVTGEQDGREVVACRLTETIPVDGHVSFDVVVDTDPALADSVVNVATLTPGLTELPDEDPRESTDPVPVREEADLTVEKTATTATATAGAEMSWTIQVRNHGPSDSDANVDAPIRITDTLPAGVTFVRAVGEGWTCTPSQDVAERRVVECALSTTLPVGDAPALTLTGLVASDVADELGNDVRVTPMLTPQPADDRPDTDTEVTPVVSAADVSIVKDLVTERLTAGAPAQYRLTVSNAGPSDAHAVVVTDALPAGLSVVSAFSADAACSAAGTVVTCSRGVLAAGASFSVQIEAAVSSAVVGTVSNTATVTTTTTDTNPTNDTSTHTGTVTTVADLTIDKSHTGDMPAGERFVWDFTVRNAGPSDARASNDEPIVVTDVLPAGITFVASDPDVCTVTGEQDDRQVVACRIADTVTAGADRRIAMTVAVDQAVNGPVTNTATLTPGITPLPDDDPRIDDDIVDVTEEANLSVGKTALASEVTAGQALSWTIGVTNHGPADSEATAADPIVVTDTLPAGVTVTGATGDGWTCVAGEPAADGQTVRCERETTLPIGDAPQITVTAKIGSDLLGDVVNTAVVAPGTTPQPADAPDDDRSTTTTPVVTSADVSIVKSIPQSFTAGETGDYRLVVHNAGPSDARGVVITDDLPAGMTFRSSTGDGVTCAADGSVVECALDAPLAAGASREVVLTVDTAANLVDDVTNRATVGTTTPDPDPSNDEDEVTGTVTTEADLQIVKTHADGAVFAAGLPFVWTLTVTNHGPSDSRAGADEPILVRDVLPAGVTLSTTVDAGAEGVACAATPGTDDREVVTCPIERTLAPGESVAIAIPVDVDEAVTGTVVNTASVTPGITPLPDLEPRESSDEVTTVEEADLSVVKTAASERVTAGETLSWTIRVTNHGPANSDATADEPLRVVDTLPAGVAFESATGDGWTCAAGEGDTVVSELATDLAVGDAADITLTGVVAAETTGEVTNRVAVEPGVTPQPVGPGEPDDDAVTTPVDTSADLALTKTLARPIVAGADGAYALTVVNLGPSVARDVTIVDALPAGLAFAGAESDDWTCEADGQEVVCALTDALGVGETRAVELTVDAAPELDGDVENTATVSTSTPDPDESNDTSTVTGTVTTFADVAIEKTATGPAVIGERLDYALVVSNAGPSESRGVVVVDETPAGLVDVTVTGEGWTCEVTPAGVVTCLLPVLAPGAVAPTITVSGTVAPAAYPLMGNTATVTPATPQADPTDPDAGDPTTDDSSTAQVTVAAASALAIEKSLVTNTGVTEEPGPIAVSDVLPDGLTLTGSSIDVEAAACATPGDELHCSLPGLAAGASATITLDVVVDLFADGRIVNVASAFSDASTGGEPISDDAAATVIPLEQTPTGGESPAPGVTPAPGGEIPATGVTIVGAGFAALLVAAGLALVALRRIRAPRVAPAERR